MTKKLLTDEDELYASIGRALTAFGKVEDAMCKLFCSVTNPRGGSRAAYWAIVSFDGRLRMTSLAIQERTEQRKFLEPWEGIKLRLSTQNTIRNKLAHGSVLQLSPTKRFPKGQWVLAPYHHARRMNEFLNTIKRYPRGKPYAPKERHSSKQIVRFRNDFLSLYEAVLAFGLIVEREACIQEGVPLADDPTHQTLLTALWLQKERENQHPEKPSGA